jgi:tetratricopeptide (TPR) repeat protein
VNNLRGGELGRALGVTIVALVLLAGAVQLEAARERRYPMPEGAESALYFTSGDAIRRISGPFEALAADLYWIRAIQYYGGAKRRLAADRLTPPPPPLLASPDADEYRLLYPLLDITTTLDPRFNIAYRFGAVFLAEAYPGGPGRPDLAIKLLEKGLRARPDKWEYMEDIGFVHYWYQHDYQSAAEAFARAAQVTGAPWWLKSLAATTLAQGGDRRSSRVMWEAIRQSAENDWLRRDAERRLTQLQALDEIDALQRIVDRLAAADGRTPADWSTIIRAQGWRGVPVDPSGAPYDLSNGRVTVSPDSTLAPLPDEPAHMMAPPS